MAITRLCLLPCRDSPISAVTRERDTEDPGRIPACPLERTHHPGRVGGRDQSEPVIYRTTSSRGSACCTDSAWPSIFLKKNWWEKKKVLLDESICKKFSYLSAHSKVKREDWTGGKREKVGQLCPSMGTGAVQGWAMVNCTHAIKQSTTASWRKTIVLLKNKPFLTCLGEFFPVHQGLPTISPPTSTQSSIPLLFFPVLRIERKHAGERFSVLVLLQIFVEE